MSSKHKIVVKEWEKIFFLENQRKPSREDLRLAPTNVKDAYYNYYYEKINIVAKNDVHTYNKDQNKCTISFRTKIVTNSGAKRDERENKLLTTFSQKIRNYANNLPLKDINQNIENWESRENLDAKDPAEQDKIDNSNLYDKDPTQSLIYLSGKEDNNTQITGTKTNISPLLQQPQDTDVNVMDLIPLEESDANHYKALKERWLIEKGEYNASKAEDYSMFLDVFKSNLQNEDGRAKIKMECRNLVLPDLLEITSEESFSLSKKRLRETISPELFKDHDALKCYRYGGMVARLLKKAKLPLIQTESHYIEIPPSPVKGIAPSIVDCSAHEAKHKSQSLAKVKGEKEPKKLLKKQRTKKMPENYQKIDISKKRYVRGKRKKKFNKKKWRYNLDK